MKSKKLVYGAVAGALALIIVSTVIIKKRASDSLKVSPKRGPIIEAIYGLGTVTSRKQFHFKVGLTKTLMRVYVQEGQQVKKGQALLELSDGVQVRSPFDGTITALPFNTGENIFPDIPLISVEDLNDRYLVANLEQQGALRVKKDMNVVLNFETIRDQTFHGKVESVYPQKGVFVVRVNVDNLPKEILPGMTADSSIQIARKENVLLVPVLAINNGRILIERNGDLIKQDIKVGIMDSEWAEVLEGDVQLTDKIIMKK